MTSLAGSIVCGVLGKACSGLSDVLLVKRSDNNKLAALRILPTEKMDYEKIKKEIWFLKWLSHPCIISVDQILSVGSDIFVFSTFYDLCSILHIIRKHYSCGLPERAIAQILKNVLLAVQYLHDQKIVHRSIRCSHILLHSTGIVKLSGFRHCTFLQRNELTGMDSVLHDFDAEISDELLWLAPEILKQDLYGYGLLSDVYSIGITICEMANGFPPFSDMDRLQMLYEKTKGTTPRLLDCTTLPDKNQRRCKSVPHHLMVSVLEMLASNSLISFLINTLGTRKRFVINDCEVDQRRRRQRRFTDSLHGITEHCLKPLPENRWPVLKLLTHPLIKSVKKNRSFTSLLPEAVRIEPSSEGDCSVTDLQVATAKLSSSLTDYQMIYHGQSLRAVSMRKNNGTIADQMILSIATHYVIQ